MGLNEVLRGSCEQVGALSVQKKEAGHQVGPAGYCLSHSASPTWSSAPRKALLAGRAQGGLLHGHLAWVGAVFVVVLFSLSGASGIFFLDYFGIFPALS